MLPKRLGRFGCLISVFCSTIIGFLFIAAFSATQSSAASCGDLSGGTGAGAGGSAGSLNTDQVHNAQVIIGVGKGKNVPQYGIEIAIATAIGESQLVVLGHGDLAGPDSRGLFQQRESWGPLAVRMDAAGSANLFYNALLKVPGWEQMSVTQAAHTVQVNQDPNYYAKYVPEAQAILAQYGNAPAITVAGPSYGGPGAAGGGCGDAGYINPIKPEWYSPARIDMGTDWLPKLPDTPVLAIGKAQITYSQTSGTGWPRYVGTPNDGRGGCVVYKLLEGKLVGKFIYVCENLDPTVKVGDQVAAGQTIAMSHSGGCCWTEWGWASGPGPSPLTPYNGAKDGTCTAGGIAFSRFLHNMGAPWNPIDVCSSPAGSFGSQPEYP